MRISVVVAVVLGTLPFAPAAAQDKAQEGGTGFRLAVPAPLKAGHDDLHATLEKASREPGPIGEAAEDVAKAMRPHFQREEEIALPPLALLPELARGGVKPGMENVLPLTDSLEAELPRMLEEHKVIVQALDRFETVARQQGRPEYVTFAQSLKRHAQEEEQILYPASILVGRYVRANPKE